MALLSACRIYVPEEEVPVVVEELTVTIDGTEVVHEDHAVLWNGPDEVSGPGCEPVWRLRDSLGDSVTVSIDVTAWADGATLLPGPEDRDTGGFLRGPATGLVGGGTGVLTLLGDHAELVWRDGSAWFDADPTAFSEVVVSFDADLPPGGWHNPTGAPGELLAPSGTPWCGLPAWEHEGWERVF